MAEKGWIKTYRQIQDCWIWKINKPFDERSAWLDLLLSANHKDTKLLFNGNLVGIERGQFITSIRNLADKWQWSKDKVLKFLRLLESDSMIQRDSDNHRTLITIVNYCIYQDKQDTEQTEESTQTSTDYGTQNGQDLATNKNDKNNKNDKESKEDIIYCSEPKAILPSEPPVITITLNDKSEYPIYQTDIVSWQELYPAVDVMQQLRSMKGWCNSNPSKRKTKKGIKRFINNWLAKEQDKGCRYVPQKNNNSDSVLDKYLKGGK